MKINRLQLDTLITGDNMDGCPSVDSTNVDVDMMYIDTKNADYDVCTSGGEYHHKCDECGETDIAEYGIHIGDILIEITPKTALSLHKILGEHLRTNGHNV